MRSRPGHLSVTILAALACSLVTLRAQTGQVAFSATYDVFFRGGRVGTETMSLSKIGEGWQIFATGSLGAPFDLRTSKFEMTYATDWQPLRLAIEASARGESITLSANFSLTSASVEMSQGPRRGSAIQPVSVRTVVLPDGFYGAYEALASRLGRALVGARYPIYVVPDGEVNATVTAITNKTLVTPEGSVQVTQYDLSIAHKTGVVAAELWADSSQHLARLVLPATELTVVRSDLASVAVREMRVRHPGDADVFIPANGFNLGATYTRPTDATGRLPAVVLVTGPLVEDRDNAIANFPVLGHIASALADAGFAVVRFDRRGTGLSGGRTESATIENYAQDVVYAVDWLRRRRDIVSDRIALVGYGDGGPVALLAAAQQKRVTGVALVGAPGRTGRENVLEQQRIELDRLDVTGAERDEKIAVQRRVIDALTMGTSWDQVPPAVRADADTPFFKSWLLFDPAGPIRKIERPILILHGALDRDVPPENASALEALGRARRNLPEVFTRTVIVPGANHLLQEAETGEPDEYGARGRRSIAPAAVKPLTDWLTELLVGAGRP